jgi:glutamate 5-kinase
MNSRIIVLKLGTGILSAGSGRIHQERLNAIAEGIQILREKEDTQTIIVSSGAVGLGMGKLGLSERPTELSDLRACAAIGQCCLMNAWTNAFERVGLLPGQVLLTREDFDDNLRSQKVKETLNSLSRNQIIPVVNENDSVSDEEIKFGDNDVLSALLSSLTNAQLLVILSTAKGLMTHPTEGELIPFVAEITPAIEEMAKGTTSVTAVGGMSTKIEAAKIATKSGCAVFIGSGESKTDLSSIITNDAEGTFFPPHGLDLNQRKKWLAFFPKPKGNIHVDDGASVAILDNGGSLLASGITQIDGPFNKADVVSLINLQGETIARGVSRFDSDELLSIKGMNNQEILEKFPGKTRAEVIHRDHLAPHL